MEEDALLGYFQRGLIPGPAELEEAFLQRAAQAQSLPHPEWKEISSAFCFSIDWVPISYSNHKIAWWEGAATCISDDQLPSIQLRTNFKTGSFLGYRRSDVLAHEAVHAARARFEEPQFEEVLAYSTAPQAWKRFLGPLFSRTWEPLLLMLSLALGIFLPWIPFLLFSLTLGWLICRQYIFKRCCRRLSLPIVLCLTDCEMRKFAWLSEPEIQAYIERNSTLRSRLLRLLFRRNGNGV